MKRLALALAATMASVPLSAHSGTVCDDCVLLRGQLWEDISSTTADFDVDCEYRITVDNFAAWEKVAFYPTYVGTVFLSVDYSKHNQLVVYSDNKAQTVGDHGTHVARTFESCPRPVPVQHQ